MLLCIDAHGEHGRNFLDAKLLTRVQILGLNHEFGTKKRQYCPDRNSWGIQSPVGFRWIRVGANEGFNLMGDFYQTRKTQKTPSETLFFFAQFVTFSLGISAI